MLFCRNEKGSGFCVCVRGFFKNNYSECVERAGRAPVTDTALAKDLELKLSHRRQGPVDPTLLVLG